jgi:hypothetical protein
MSRPFLAFARPPALGEEEPSCIRIWTGSFGGLFFYSKYASTGVRISGKFSTSPRWRFTDSPPGPGFIEKGAGPNTSGGKKGPLYKNRYMRRGICIV